MDELDLNTLLQESYQEDFSVPDTIDRQTRQRMAAVAEKKQYYLTFALITLSLLLTVLWMMVMLTWITTPLQRLLVLYCNASLLGFLIFSYVANYITKIKKEVL
jgi:hypothetical protein